MSNEAARDAREGEPVIVLAQGEAVVKEAEGAGPSPQEQQDQGRLEQAVKARKDGLLTVARDLLAEMLKRRPGWPPARRELVALHIAAEELADAERLLLVETKRAPQERWAWMSLGLVRSRTGDRKGEIEALAKVLELRFEAPLARRLFELQRDTQDLAGALDTVVLLRRHEDSEALAVAQCQLLARLKRREEALALCEELMERSPAPAGAVDQWGTLHLVEANDPETVIQALGRRIAAGREDAAFYHGLARALHRADRNNDAVMALRRALELDPKQVQWWYDLAVIQRQVGDVPGSQESLQRALALDPVNPTVLRVFGVEHKYAVGDEAGKRLNLALAVADRFRPEKKVELYFAAAKAAEDTGDLATAFAYYENAGRLQGQLTPYRHAAAESLLKLTRLRTTTATFAKVREVGFASEVPVFVLGMPRSGTSLAEQIIASHPQAYGAGELKVLHRLLDGVSVNGKVLNTGDQQGVIPTYIPGMELSVKGLTLRERGERYVQALQAVARAAGQGEARRIVDKMPGNYYWTGVIPFILPGARIVHTRRHPVDTCVSIYRIYFPDGMSWGYDLTNLGKVYRGYHEHMQHWEKTLPEGILLSVRYEDVVANVEREARRIIGHIGLEWNDTCLRFYETERSVRTASLAQVRQPIYASAIGRWKKYEPYLKPLLNELGPLVREYEEELESAYR